MRPGRPSETGGRAIALRAPASVIAFWALAGIAAVFVADAGARGRVELALRAGAVLAFVVWCAWTFLVRMSLRVDSTALLARNLLRWVRVPWTHVVDIERRAQLRVVLDDGSTVECWGSPFPPRSGAPRHAVASSANPFAPGATAPSARPGSGADGALATVRAAWQAGGRPDEPVTRGWDIPALVAGAVLAVLAVLAVVL